ncbi:hypothetical protein QE152_g26388 [Popillia japonica]|uniref:Uncharacterized protein n=1 Tax=Popillia japonica TaxID=7064 RepID=A0AAW1JY33_POPJA
MEPYEVMPSSIVVFIMIEEESLETLTSRTLLGNVTLEWTATPSSTSCPSLQEQYVAALCMPPYWDLNCLAYPRMKPYEVLASSIVVFVMVEEESVA